MYTVRFFGPLLAGAVFAAPAFAVTPEEVWQAWQTQYTAQDLILTAGAETRAGDTLTLSDVKIGFDQDGLKVSSDVGTITLRDRGDATVEILQADSYDVLIEGDDGGPFRVTLDVTQAGAVTIASGTAEVITYDVTAPEVSLTLREVFANGKVRPVDGSLSIKNITGTYTVGSGDLETLDLTLAAQSISLSAAARNDEGDGNFRFDLASAALAIAVKGAYATGIPDEDFAAALAAGLDMGVTYDVGATTFDFDFADSNETSNARGSFDTAGVSFAINADRLSYGTSTTTLDLTIGGSTIPFPELRVTLAEFTNAFSLPIAQSDESQDFSFLARMVDLVLPDEVWGMFDPTGALPRDPATVVLDASGEVFVNADITDPEESFDTPPGELHTIDLTEIRLAAVGAELTGKGAFTFDNEDLVTFDGLPRPTGAIDLRLVGGNALLDKLAAMGLIPSDQLMGARMMLGLFARPGDGPDTLVSKIEVTPEGAVLANGQRLR